MATIKTELWLPTNEVITVDLDREFRILPNFRLWELANNKAKEDIKLVIPSKWAWLELRMLQLTRDHFGRIDVNSYYRTESFNKECGGDENSCHLIGEAVDISRPNQTMPLRNEWTEWWRKLCREFDQVGAIGLYPWGYHLEIGSDRRFGQTEFKVRNYL